MTSKHILSLVLCLAVFVSSVIAQDEIKELPSGYYMTVAAYLSTGEGYAIRYTKKLQAQGYSAEYGFTYKKNMYFVYIKQFNNFKAAINEINSTRKNTPFNDAWVYAYTSINPEAEASVEVVKVTTLREEPEEVAKDSVASIEQVKIIVNEEIIEPEKEIIPDGSRLIYFISVNARTHKPINIEFRLYDPVDERMIATLKSWKSEVVLPPKNKQQIARITTNTFGWKKDEVSFNFVNPVTDSTNYFAKIDNDTLIFFFEMHRMRQGDIQTLFNVYFYNESSIMLRDSKFQLYELLTMLKENQEFRIKLHGHTNGSAAGAYTRLAQGDTVFFKMNRKHERTTGSAKKLSFDRANTVKQFLIANGVTEDRIEVRGWGGKKQIYDENSNGAKRNIRVEVEVLEE